MANRARTMRPGRHVIAMALRLLNASERRWMVGLAVLATITELLQMAALLSVMPIVAVILDPAMLQGAGMLARVYDAVGAPGLDAFVLGFAGCALILTVIGHVGAFLVQVAIGVFVHRIQLRMGSKLLSQILSAPYAWFLCENAAALVRTLQNDVTLWSRDVVGGLLKMATQVITVLIACAVVVATAPLTGVIALLVPIVAAVFVLRALRGWQIGWSQRKRAAAERTAITLNESFSGVKDVQITGSASHFVGRFRRDFGDMSYAAHALLLFGQAPPALLLMFGQVALLFFAVVVWRTMGGGQEAAALLAIIVLVSARVVPAVSRVSASAAVITNALPWVEAIAALRESVDRAHAQAPTASGPTPPPADWAVIRAERLSYAYPNARGHAVEAVSFEIERGGIYGLVGPSGSGKSTIVDLLLGLLRPSAGRVLIGRTPLSEIDASAWRRAIGYVPQTPYLVHASLRENVAFGLSRGAADDDRVRDCLRRAGLDAFLSSLPDGLDTDLGDRGASLSGGQRQRVAIARALYKQPEILVLDEATSALDAETEQRIQRTILALRGHVTVVIVSHRSSSILGCDAVLKLNDGALETRSLASGDIDLDAIVEGTRHDA